MVEAVGDHNQLRGGPPRMWSRTFPGRPDQIRHARQCLAPMLDGCPVADDAILCLSELATNSVIHSDSRNLGGTFTVRAEVSDGEYVRLEVHDRGGPWLERRHTDGRAHGLAIVRDLASDSGVDGDALAGWIAWARLDWPAPETALPDAAVATAAPIQGLQALSAELARCDTSTAWISAGTRDGRLMLVQGQTISYAAGFFWWPTGRLSRGRPLYAVHRAHDPAGAARRIACLPAGQPNDDPVRTSRVRRS
ncbi:MAG: ATP-binding protein [Streptosporangiaceae bacterium]